MEDLIFEYKRSLKEARKMYKHFKEIDPVKLTAKQSSDKKLISSMISDLEYTIEWLEKGRQPGAKRGYDRRDSYKRMLIKDPKIIETFSKDINKESDEEVSSWDLERINDALSVLTNREKEIFLLNKVQLYSYEEIADVLGVSKSTVQTNMKRAENKMMKRQGESLFCLA
ncbi:sigma-70 family RNA polymerase sigma factor [Metabacillus litoralis]|uniref:sigma-70 family RNA polymerase sigma factor n=1 Tax=Metabacillus litoralis TaxID=152268 RepID=UPI00203C651C|nr:sigma-70 family RNA polymerase sigma factor [Metabacillus litoralis]MCM3651316.1 sigma-70 family RNA polymerase sigma factor [Metabacillus litoralis]